MKKIIRTGFLLLVVLLSLFACKKEGTGGKAEIALTVKHHGLAIPGATVYIKYGANEFPGKDISKYDASKVAGMVGSSKGTASFNELQKGNYYLYAVGYDSTIAMPVAGGISVKVKKKQEKLSVDVPVTEE